MTRKYFGTDGIRGRVGAGTITPEFVLKLGWAAGKVFAKRGHGKILIGKDTRISGYMFESALEAGLVAAGVDVALLGPMPTPAVAYLTRTFHGQAGIVISASHNPYYDNGIKFFSGRGSKLDDEIELEIEAMIEQPMTTVESSRLGKVNRINDAAGRYIEYCKSTVPNNFDLAGMTIVLDCAHGATYHVAPAVFTELGAKVHVIGDKPDGLNINENVGSTAPLALSKAVVQLKADLGIAFDGDGDRVAFVDERGVVLDGDELLFIIARAMVRNQQALPGVVGTLMSNLGLELALRDMGVALERAKVGDRYVNELMLERGWTLGGESSGHIICHDVSTTGDGIVAALKVLLAIKADAAGLSAIRSELRKAPQCMINVALAQRGMDVAGIPAVKAHIEQIETQLAGRGRVLLRPSGTEPVVRVMIEGEDESLVQQLVEDLAETVRQAVA